jgi:predicted ATPase/DNA-binding SARP family transcriptional activator/tetratricopeptide (TPR) repeat protein
MAETTQLRLLGTVQVERDGDVLRGLRSRKALGLLGYLAVREQRIPRERLAGLFWESMPEARGRANLSWVLSRISTLLPGCLLADRHSLQFQRTPSTWLDLDAYRELEARGDATSLAMAVGLYRGEFLDGLYLQDCAEFEIWLVAERERWRQRAVRAMETLVAHCGQRGRYDEALRFSRRLLALEPGRERAHRRAMLLLARSGRPNAALAQYEVCRRFLTEELGAEPGEATQALYERIRSVALHPSALVRVPSPPTPLVGRQGDLGEIARFCANPAQRLLTVIGPGGIGKTHLALQAAREAGQAGRFLEGVVFVPLDPVAATDSLVPTIAESLPLSFHGPANPDAQLLSYLEGKEMLLVLDSFEHLQAGTDLLSEILARAPDVKLLVTSRERLHLQGECVLEVEGLRFPKEGTAAIDEDYGAIALFLQSASRIGTDLNYTLAELPGVASVCRLVQGVPLGIILAAAWVPLLSPAEIAEQIERSLDFLKTDLRDLPDRLRSLRATFNHSWRLLADEEQEAFRRLSVFRGGLTHEAAQHVAGASLGMLKSLVDKSLLRRMPTPSASSSDGPSRGGRYEFHELLRQYATEQLDRAPAVAESTRDRHNAYYVRFLQQLEAELKGPGQQSALAEIEADGENVRTAWNWAVERQHADRLDLALESLCRFYEWRGRYRDGEAACQIAAESLSEAASPAEVRVLASLLAWQAFFASRQGHTTAAHKLLQQSTGLLDSPRLASLETRARRAFGLLEMGRLVANSDLGKARQLCEQGLALYRILDDRWGSAQALGRLGWIAQESGALGEAQRMGSECLALHQALGDQKGIARSLADLGFLAHLRGRSEESVRLLGESVAAYRDLGDLAGLAKSLSFLKSALIFSGNFVEAQACLEESLATARNLGLREEWARSRTDIGLLHLHQGQYKRAQAMGERELTFARELGDQRLEAYSLLLLGFIALAREAYLDAQKLLGNSAAIYREVGQWATLSWALAPLSAANLRLGNVPEAKQHLIEALHIAAETGSLTFLLPPLVAGAAFLAHQGEPERAVEIYSMISCHPWVSNWAWLEDIAGSYVRAVASTLPPETVKAAQARGRALDPWVTSADLLSHLTNPPSSMSSIASMHSGAAR